MKLLKLIWRGWMAFARVLGKVNTAIVLSAIYFLIVPLFSFWRLKDPLGLRLRTNKGAPSYWIERPTTAEPETIERCLLPR